jgi:hypothetical protein
VKGGGLISAEIVNPQDKSRVMEVVVHDEKDGTYRRDGEKCRRCV